jgi:hypothetical protein
MSTRKRPTEMNRGYSMVYGTDEYFESGGRGHNIYFTSKYRGQQRIFSIVISSPQFRCIRIVPVKYIRLNWKLRKANNYIYSLSIKTNSAL